MVSRSQKGGNMKYPKLLDCPHCGEIATLAKDERTKPTSWHVVCTFSGASIGGPIFPYSSPEAVAKAWNTRGGIYMNPDDIK